MKWTEKQQEAISIRDKNILVSAAAGSGKTAVLVERIKGLLLEDGAELSRMLIVTFSNAAASEMKEKIVAALSKELEQMGRAAAQGEKPDRDKQRFLLRQLTTIHRCNISTFHAFAMEVIRRYFHLIDAEPSFRICDEGQKTIMQAEAIDQVFSQRFEERDPDFLHFLGQYGSGKNENDVKDMVLTLHAFIQSLPEPFAWLEEKTEALSAGLEEFIRGPAYKRLCQEIHEGLELVSFYMKEAERLLEENGVASLLPKIRTDIAMIDGALEASGSGQLSGALACLRGEKGGFARLVAAKADKEAYEAVKEEAGAMRDRGRAIFKKLAAQYAARTLEEYIEEMNETAAPARRLYRLVLAFDEAYRDKKEKKSMLDFNDIEHYALKILAREEAAREYREKFQYIFIDEYQDSNLVQETLINRIQRENNVFMVGDVKQSIYKFRLAEPELFIEKYRRFKESEQGTDAKIDLNRNFRSKGNIISSINTVFSRIMNQASTEMDYDSDAALYKGVAYEGELDYGVSMHVVDAAQIERGEGETETVDEEIRDMKKAELEAYAAARIIKEARGKLIYDGKKDCIRPLEIRDMVILLRGARGYADLFYKALNDEGIGAFMDNSDGYFDTIEIQVFLNLLQIIDNERQDLPLLSVLRSPILDFSIGELAEIRLGKREGAYYEAFHHYGEQGEAEELRLKCGRAIRRLSEWREKAAYTPLSDFLSLLISDTGYGDFIAAIPGGLQRQANLRALVDKAIEYEAAQSKGLFGFIRYIEALKKQKISVGQVRLAGENDDVVRIMTIHKSKGLEFPFVLAAGLGRRFNLRQDTSKLSCHKELGISLRLVNADEGYYKKTLLQSLIEQKKRREDMAEEIRTLYVAFTRAMDELVLLGTVSDGEKALKGHRLSCEKDALSAGCYLDFIIPALFSGEGPGASAPPVSGEGPEAISGPRLYRHDRSEYSVDKKMDGGEREALRRDIAFGFVIEEEAGLEEYEIGGPESAGKTEPRTEPESAESAAALAEEIRRRLSYVYPVVKKEKKSKYTVSQLANPPKEERGEEDFVLVETVPRFIQPIRELTAAERGTAIHKVMEQIPFTLEKKSIGEIRDFVQELVQREILTAEEAAAVDVKAVSAFFQSEIGRRACLAPELYREVSFNMRKLLDGESIIVQGTIDCYFKEQDQVVLLDYKSNYISGGRSPERDSQVVAELAAHYRPQLELYKEALEKIRGAVVKEGCLYLFSLGKEIRIM